MRASYILVPAVVLVAFAVLDRVLTSESPKELPSATRIKEGEGEFDLKKIVEQANASQAQPVPVSRTSLQHSYDPQAVAHVAAGFRRYWTAPQPEAHAFSSGCVRDHGPNAHR